MQNVVFDKPYEFIPPHRGDFLPWLLRTLKVPDGWLRDNEGVTSYEIRHVERVKASLAAGHGIVLAPNHSRPGDPMLMGWLTKEMGHLIYAMASWHLFNAGWVSGLGIKLMGGFSVYREGTDRRSLETAIEILANAERPLVLFPEGTTTRTNDVLHPLLDGVAFVARQGAKRRAKQGGKVVIHPVGIKYLFPHPLEAAINPVLDALEKRLTWHPQSHLPAIERIKKLGTSLLGIKELEYFGAVQGGSVEDRQMNLIDRLLEPLEATWMNGNAGSGGVVSRVKNLRSRIVPDLVEAKHTPEEKHELWRQLHDIYLAQQLSCYPPGYLSGSPSVERLLETVERYEEDMTDKVTAHPGRKVIIDIGEPIEVNPKRDRKAEVDPLMESIRTELEAMLTELQKESTPYEPA